MESCEAVERELEKVVSKFAYIDKHTANSLQELLTHVEGVKRGLLEATSGSTSYLFYIYVTGKVYNQSMYTLPRQRIQSLFHSFNVYID